MSSRKQQLTEIAISSLFTAIICILAQIAILTPWGVPFTLQIFAVSLCGYLLGIKKAICSVLAYILLGLIGIPVFSGFKGGIHTLFGITGGFLFGFLAIALFCGIAKNVEKPHFKIILSVLGVIICHLCGTVQLSIVSKSNILSAFVTASLTFILKDFLLVFLALFISKPINNRFKFL